MSALAISQFDRRGALRSGLFRADDLTASADLKSKDHAEDENEQEPKKHSQQILRHELNEAMDALQRSSWRLFCSALSAGLEIGFSLYLMAQMHSIIDGQLPAALEEILIGNMYAFGFILVIVGRSELFTEQTSLAVMPVLNGRASVRDLLRLWGIVYLGNILGAAIFAAMIVRISPAMGTIQIEEFKTIASRVVDHPAAVMFQSAVLAGWLMGLLSWLVAASRDTVSQIILVWMITTVIGLAHFHHSIVGSVEMLAGVFSSSEITWAHYGYFLLWTTLGNAIGGPVFVALLKYTHARPHSMPREHLKVKTGGS